MVFHFLLLLVVEYRSEFLVDFFLQRGQFVFLLVR